VPDSLTYSTPPLPGKVGNADQETDLGISLDGLVEQGDDRLLAELRFRLQIERFSWAERADPAVRLAEACRVLERIRREQEGFAHWRHTAGGLVLNPHRDSLRMVPADVARILCERFHYIGTSREGIYLGLYSSTYSTEAPPSTLLVFSPFDLEEYRHCLPPDIFPDNILVLSRVYTFRWAPRNAFSYCFSRAVRILRSYFPALALVLTYVNRNLGFTAASYLASNWRFFGEEGNTQYDYLDGEYITRRELARRFGCADQKKLQSLVGGRLSQSRVLAPLGLWEYRVCRSKGDDFFGRRK
jgi:hypothetical protein